MGVLEVIWGLGVFVPAFPVDISSLISSMLASPCILLKKGLWGKSSLETTGRRAWWSGVWAPGPDRLAAHCGFP